MRTIVSLDLGSYTLKAVQASKSNPIQVTRTVEVFNPTGTVIPSGEADSEKLAQLIGTLFQDHSLSKQDVRLALPESAVSTKIITIPMLTDAELASAINWQAEQHIPIPLDELSLEYQVISRPAKKEKDAQMQVLLVGARKNIVESYLNVFLEAGVEPTLLETSVLSNFRGMSFTPEDPTSLVVHMGASTTEMFIVHEGQLQFVYTYASGGQVLTRAIEQSVQLDPKQAEQYKRTYGIDPQHLNGKLREVLLPILKLLTLEMQKTVQFFISQKQVPAVKRVVLSGGGSQMPGLAQFITEQLNAEVLSAAPFTGMTGEIPTTNQAAFAVCAGLLTREI